MTTNLQPVDHHLTGPADQLGNVLRSAHARGHLVRYGRPSRLADGRYAIDVTLLEPRRHRIRWRLVLKVAAIVAGLTALAGLGWGVWLLVQWVIAHWMVIVGTVVLVLVVAGLMAAKTDGCAGLHCRGCGRR
ncbi:hypothetical protein ABT297_19585 [Dactylosporangium sp. NPDC000555]|uniref:hypothetical protein n=1 Tax=Dactylosporangium sp. NPDC000555 TaxID=3154260 RepID=UPI00331AB365